MAISSPRTSFPDHKITAELIEFTELPQSVPSPVENARPLVADLGPILNVRTRVTVLVGEVELSVADLLSARENQVLMLDRTIDQPVDLCVEGKVVARGQLVAVDDHFGVRIVETPLGQLPPTRN